MYAAIAVGVIIIGVSIFFVYSSDQAKERGKAFGKAIEFVQNDLRKLTHSFDSKVSMFKKGDISKGEFSAFAEKHEREMEKIEYAGTVYLLDHKYPEPLLNHSIKKLRQFGIKKEDIIITDSPDNPQIGNIVVEVFPYHLDIARIRTIRNESFISGLVTTVELKIDTDGKYID